MAQLGVTWALIAAMLSINAAGCDVPSPDSAPTSRPQRPSPTPADIVWQTPMTGPTGLQVLIAGRLVNIDTGTVSTRDLWERLLPVAGPPIFVVRSGTNQVGRAHIELATSMGDLPGNPAILAVAGGYFQLAASIDGRSVWISEYLSHTRCTLREVWLDGRTKRPARDVPCGVDPVAQTETGLWVRRWENWFTMDHHFDEQSWREPTYALLNPDTLAETCQLSRGPHPGPTICADYGRLRDEYDPARSGRHRHVGQAQPHSGFVFNGFWPVVPVSPDGRHAIFRYGSHSVSPQMIDLWVLDLAGAVWLHVPGMPIDGGLKHASEAWSADGRLVMIGDYGSVKPILGTWRPGDAKVAVLPYNPIPPDAFNQGFQIFAW